MVISIFSAREQARHLLGVGDGLQKGSASRQKGLGGRGDWQWVGKTGKTGRIAGPAGRWGPGGREKELLGGERREAGSKIRLSWSQLARQGFTSLLGTCIMRG